MNAFETGLLQFLAMAAPTIETLFIHNKKSVAIFNASDELLNGVVTAMTPVTPTAPTAPPATP